MKNKRNIPTNTSSTASRLNLKPRNLSAESHTHKHNNNNSDDDHDNDKGNDNNNYNDEDTFKQANSASRSSRRTNSTEIHHPNEPTNARLLLNANQVHKSNTFQLRSGKPKIARGKSLEINETNTNTNNDNENNNSYSYSIKIKNNSNTTTTNNNNNTTPCQLKRVINHSNQQQPAQNQQNPSSRPTNSIIAIKSSAASCQPKVLPITISPLRKEASLEFPTSSQRTNNIINKDSSDPWIRRSAPDSNARLLSAANPDKESMLSLVESSAAPSSGSDGDGDVDTNAKHINNNSKYGVYNNDASLNHSKVTFDPKLEFI